jgi:putative salt-induced outer membrane protein YdiY
MKLFKTVPVLIVLAGGVLASLNAAADDTVFTVMDDPSTAKKPFEGSVNGGYLAQSGNTTSSSLTADSTLTWYGYNYRMVFIEPRATPHQMMSVPQRNIPQVDVAVTT